MDGISVVINVVREELPFLKRALESVRELAAEIVLVDMTESTKLKEIAEEFGAKVYEHKFVPYVEPARNYGIGKARADWVLIMDPDEELSETLIRTIQKATAGMQGEYFRLPRKNIIFGKWLEHSRFWPDYNIRLFKKGHVVWEDTIHSVPITKGKGIDIVATEENAIIHHNYITLNQYLARMDRYTSVQALHLESKNYKFIWMDLIRRPVGEFMSRYFAGEGYKDGLHGLALAMLQAFSELVLYLKIWESEKFMEQSIGVKELTQEFGSLEGEMNWWLTDILIKNKGLLTSLPLRVRRKLLKSKHG